MAEIGFIGFIVLLILFLMILSIAINIGMIRRELHKIRKMFEADWENLMKDIERIRYLLTVQKPK